jgi:phosphoribosylanthranilate isomerase
MNIKICGITNLEDARFCAGAGADFLGFIQYPESPRYVDPEMANQIIAWVYGPRPVGVFVNEDAATINRICETAGFQLAQLHGNEPPEVCAAVDQSIIKAFRIAPGESVDAIRTRMERYRDVADYFLLDTHHPTLWGGTGVTFDWDIARRLAIDYPVFLAGGISQANVAEAVTAVDPFGVDLSSSLEAHPGKKDFDKVGAFFDALPKMM